MSTITKKRKVINYLTSGRGLTENEARSRFGVGNMRATMSDIRSEFEQYGNWKITNQPLLVRSVTLCRISILVLVPTDMMLLEPATCFDGVSSS